MLLLAIPKGLFPYGYYNLLRIVVCGTGTFLVVVAHRQKNIKWTWIMAIIAFVFNPILPLHLGKEIWVMIDVVAGVIFLISIFSLRIKKLENL